MVRTSNLLVVAVTGFFSLTDVTFAQTSDAKAGTTPSTQDARSSGLEEIVVTAQRVEENAQRAAIAISVLQPSELANVVSPVQLGALAPALQFGNNGNGPLLYVRGVGTFSGGPYNDPAVAVNYDGVYLGRVTSTKGLFYDLERIEILKGPQGTLYGRNATGGALNINPAKPELGKYSFSGLLDVGNYESINAQGAVNIPVSDRAAFRFAGVSYTHDAYNSDGTFAEKGTGGRAQFLVALTDAVELRVSGDYFDAGGSGATGILRGRPDAATGTTIPIDFDGEVGMYDQRSRDILNSSQGFSAAAGGPYHELPARPRMDNQYYGVTSELNADLGWAQLTIVPAWRKAELDQIDQPSTFLIQSDESDEQASLEARLQGKIGSFDWLAGLYGFEEDVSSIFLVNSNYTGSSQNLKASNDSYAGFGRLTWNATDAFRLTAAARYTEDKKKFDGINNSAGAICTQAACPNGRPLPADIRDLNAALASIGYIRPPGSPVYVDVAGSSGLIWSPSDIPVNQSLTDSKPTYRLAAEFEPRGGSLLYASFETGYRSGGFAFSTVDSTYGPETIDAYTIGSKNRLFDNRLQLNIELFHWSYKDQQAGHTSVGRTGAIEFITENIGESTHRGVEIELLAKPVSNTVLHANVQYLDAKNDKFVYSETDTGVFAGLPAGVVKPDSACPATSDPATGTYRIDCSDLKALRSPEWTLNAGFQQTLPLGNGYQFVLGADTHYQTSSILMFERGALSTQPSYWRSSADLTLKPDDERWALTAYVDNIEGDRQANNVALGLYNGLTVGNYAPPRTYGLRFNFDF